MTQPLLLLGIISGILPLRFAFAQPEQAPKGLVCTITINSTEEATVFKDNLEPQGFKFRDLTVHTGTDSQDWFAQACESAKKDNAHCDVLLISGHFAGGFFGKSGKSLQLEMLERQACSKSCDGILNDPKAVYIFGCNTLASKAPDIRTPKQYLKVLQDDGVPVAKAERIVAERYSPIGPANKERMLGVFGNSPRIIGFDSTSPYGQDSMTNLESFFKITPDYRAFLNTIAEERSEKNKSKTLREFNAQNNKLSDPFQRCMSNTSVTCADGVCQKNQHLTDELCLLRDESLPLKDRLTLLQSDLSSPEALAYIPTAEKMLRDVDPSKMSAEEKVEFLKIQKNSLAKNKFMPVLQKLDYLPFLSLSYIKFAEKLSWVSKDQSFNERQKIVYGWFTHLKDRENQNLVVGVWNEGQVQEFIKRMPESVVLSLVDQMKDPDARSTAESTLIHLNPLSQKVLEKIGFEKDHAQDSSTRITAISVLKTQEPLAPLWLKKIANSLKDPDPYVREHVMMTLIDLNALDQDSVTQIEKQSEDPKSAVRLWAARAMGLAPEPDQEIIGRLVKMLKDEDHRARNEADDSLSLIQKNHPGLISEDLLKEIQKIDSAPGFGIQW